MYNLSQIISIPAHAHDVSLTRLPLSTRLANVLFNLGYQWLGDLHGKNYRHIFQAKNCGIASIEELMKLVRRLSFDELQYLNEDKARELLSSLSQSIAIPAHAHDVALSRLPLSVSLDQVLQDLGYQTLGDLDGKTYRHISNGKNCGVTVLGEVQNLVERLSSAGLASLTEEIPPVRPGDLPEQTISIPAHAHRMLLSRLPLSTRLWKVLTRLDCWSLGDLHGKNYQQISAHRHCGSKTVAELERIIGQVSAGESPQIIVSPEPARVIRPVSPSEPPARIGSIELQSFSGVLSVPPHAWDWPLAQLPLTARLANVLERWECQRLSDLHGKTLAELWQRRNCGRHSLTELHQLLQQIAAGEYDQFMESAYDPDLGRFILRLDERIESLPPRKREILISRLGGEGQAPVSLGELGQQRGLTRERIRQLEVVTMEHLRRSGGPAQASVLSQLAKRCEAGVCPLTSDLLAHWLGATVTECRYALPFYLRLFGELNAQLPVWVEGRRPGATDAVVKAIARRVRNCMSEEPASLPLSTVFARLRALDSFNQASPQAFLTALRIDASLQVEFPHPEQPMLAPVKLDRKRKLNTREWAQLILAEAGRAMRPEELVAAAQQKFGAEFEPASVSYLEVHLPASEGFYLLGTRLVGLRQHIQLPETLWSQAKNELYDFLQQRKCATSVREAFGELAGDWTRQTNAHELACVLREDERFIEERYFHFALAEWDQEERVALRARVTEVLAQVGHPLSLGELAPQVQRFLASATLPALREALPDHPEVCHYGHEYYGLKVWGKRAYAFLVKEAGYVSDLMAGTEPPLTFADLCRLMKISPHGKLAGQLWQTVHALPRMRCRPDQQAPETLLWHRIWKFEYLLCLILEKAGKPLPFDRIQAKLIAGLKPDAQVPTDLAQRLQQSRLFVCDRQGRYGLAARPA